MKYMMNCPMCQAKMEVMSDEEMSAMSQMKEEAKTHMMSMHPEAKMMEDEEMDKMIKESWKTEE
jgi:hypothetical protein